LIDKGLKWKWEGRRRRKRRRRRVIVEFGIKAKLSI
jgi:hypothetical protein